MRLSRIAVVLAVAACAIPVQAQQSESPWDFPDFSGTQVFPTGKYDITMKVYRSGSDVRVERDANGMAPELWITATRKAYNISVYADGKRSCEVSAPEQALMMPSPLELLFGAKVMRTPAGTEVVEGHTCKVEKVVVTRMDGKTTVESKVWEAEDLKGVPVKIESQHPGGAHLIAVYRDIVLGTPDKALFTPPDKCIPFEKMWQIAK